MEKIVYQVISVISFIILMVSIVGSGAMSNNSNSTVQDPITTQPVKNETPDKPVVTPKPVETETPYVDPYAARKEQKQLEEGVKGNEPADTTEAIIENTPEPAQEETPIQVETPEPKQETKKPSIDNGVLQYTELKEQMIIKPPKTVFNGKVGEGGNIKIGEQWEGKNFIIIVG
jgi:hypothetical protein